MSVSSSYIFHKTLLDPIASRTNVTKWVEVIVLWKIKHSVVKYSFTGPDGAVVNHRLMGW